MLGDLRKRVILGQHQPRIGFVVPQDDVEARPKALDEVGLEQQRLGLGVGGDDLHRDRLRHHPPQPLRQARRLGVRHHTLLEAARLADIQRLALAIEHPVDAGTERHGRERTPDRLRALDRRLYVRHGSIVGHRR